MRGRAIQPNGTVDWKLAAIGWRKRARTAEAALREIQNGRWCEPFIWPRECGSCAPCLARRALGLSTLEAVKHDRLVREPAEEAETA